jgi:hypothetical protein
MEQKIKNRSCKTEVLFENKGVRVEILPVGVRKVVLEGDLQLVGNLSPNQMVNREVQALKILKSSKVLLGRIPVLLQRKDGNSFDMSLVKGVNLKKRDIWKNKKYYTEIQILLNEMSELGVIRIGHNVKDFILMEDGRIGIVDFGFIVLPSDDKILRTIAKLFSRLRLYKIFGI